ncbi:hypothetical protein QAD02_019934 [Eretmocerus hayati]|uniref:Uncharacterized protein n=1 Tax=Eretmocerus hayati TaxID=131215 RepID=A0ACC2PL79_9HYME|nr:hypothetical protein QAD02_019934 [Eretmocerus hayati]
MLHNLEANDPHFGAIRIMNVRRFARRNIDPSTGKLTTPSPTKTVQITFRGQYMPPRVTLYKITMNTEIYYPQVRQCYRCYNFGHLKVNCESALELCQRCADPVHSTDLPCPRKDKQPQEIRDYATENNLTVSEAKRRISARREYQLNANDFPALSNRWSVLQDYQESGTYDDTLNYAAATSSKKYQNRGREYRNSNRNLKNDVRSHNIQSQQFSSANQNNETASPKDGDKYQKTRLQHKNLLINPNGNIPNMSYGRFHGSQSPLSQLQAQDQDLHDSLEMVMSTLLQKFSIEKLYSALDTIATYRNMENNRSRRNTSKTRKKQHEVKMNEDERWKLEYSTPPPWLEQPVNNEALSQSKQLSQTLSQQLPTDLVGPADKDREGNPLN